MDDNPLLAALAESHLLGSLGEPPDIAQAGSLPFVRQCPPGRVAELGSGGGVPGLVIAWHRQDIELVCIERREQRADHLRRLVARLGLSKRVTVIGTDAARVGRDARTRESFDAVVARSFGPPAIVAEAASPLLRVDGVILVSEPPGMPDRWPPTELQLLGLRTNGCVDGLQVLTKVEPVDDRFPRRRLHPPLF
jgi:16S rRNA (guanine527-N7)-methyltransferase